MKKSMAHRQFSKQFKMDAVELTAKGEKSIKEIAEDLGLRPALLYRWRQKYFTAKEDAFPGTGNAKDAETERIRQLERELRLVSEERDILKKACAVFMKTP